MPRLLALSRTFNVDLRIRRTTANTPTKPKPFFNFHFSHTISLPHLAMSSSSDIKIPRRGPRGGGRPSKGLEEY